MLMEKDQNPMPDLNLFPRLERAGRCLARLIRFLPQDAPDFMSDHYRADVQPASDPEARMQQYWQGVLNYGTQPE